MREISLNIMDLAQNSIKANATLIEILVVISEKENLIEFTISDNGIGMTDIELKQVIDPFFTSRTSRRVGLGIPFCKLACEQAGGSFEISSEKNVGTLLRASFQYNNINRQPMGDLVSTILLTSTANESSDVLFNYKTDDTEFVFDTREIKKVLEGVPINTPEVFEYLKEMLNEGIKTKV
jgi:hypothetical protein